MVTAVEDVLPPFWVVEIPLDGFAEARLEGFSGFPAEVGADLGGVDGVAEVVPRTVGDECDLRFVGFRARVEFVKNTADRFDEVEVGLFVIAADVVGFARNAFFEDGAQGGAMIADVKPVADIPALSINGNGLASETLENHHGDEFFGKLTGTVVVRAVRHEDGQFVGVLPCAGEVIRGGFARGIRRMRGIQIGFRKTGCVNFEGTVNFVRGDMEETESRLFFWTQSPVVAECGLEKVIGAEDVGVNEVFRTVDGSVHVALGGEVHDGIRRVFFKEAVDDGGIANIGLDKGVVRVIKAASKGGKVSRIGELVDIDDLMGGFINDLTNEIGANEAGATGN